MIVKNRSWNVRGLNGESKRGIVRKLLKQWEADTKLERSIDNIYKAFGVTNGWGVNEGAQGSSGGILILWDRRIWRGSCF